MRSSSTLVRTFGILGLAVTCSASMAQTDKNLTVDQAVEYGLKHNPQITGGLAGVAVALATYQSIGILPNFVFGVSQVQGSSSAPSLTGDTRDTIVSLSTTVDLSGQRRYQAAGSHATYKASGYQFHETLLSLEQQIRDAYWTLAASRATTTLTRKSLEETQKVYDLTVVQEQAGTSPKGDVLRASIDVANAKQALLVAEGNEETALIAFNTLLAKSPKEVAVLTEDILNEGSLPKGPLAPTEELVRMATGKRPAIKASVESVKAANFGVRQAESTRLPDLNVQYERSTVQQVDALSFTLSLPLFDFGSIRESVRAAKENRKQVEAQKRSTESQVAQQVSQARSDLDIALKSAKSYRTEILEPSAKLFEMANLGYQNGATGILPVIDASSTLRNARVGYIGTLLAIHKAEDELNASIGNSRFLSVIRPGVK